jgi:hypothetical protein
VPAGSPFPAVTMIPLVSVMSMMSVHFLPS